MPQNEGSVSGGADKLCITRRTAKFLSIGAALPLILRHSVRFHMLMRFTTCADTHMHPAHSATAAFLARDARQSASGISANN